MRIEQITRLLPARFHAFTNLLVGVRRSGYLGSDGCMRTAIQVEHTGKVLGSPTSIALAMVATDGRGLYCPVCKY